MKLFCVVLLCSVAVIVKAQSSKEEAIVAFRSTAQECKDETNANDADVQAMIKQEPADSPEGKCLRACVMKKYEIMDSNGKLSKPMALKLIESISQGDAAKLKLAEEAIDACKDLAVSENHCEAAEQYGNCGHREAKSRGLASLRN